MNGRVYDPILGQFMQADNFAEAYKDGNVYNSSLYLSFKGYRIGWNAGWVQDWTQNWFHKIIHSPYFPVPNYSGFYFEQYYNKRFSLFSY